ncbi:AAA family ATPase [Promicromonospora vindobonensis]|uniref:AAA family ATPase n=1 Tax=Promicromonospora vindobonensis TaxID=195748 RepID=A0ABW5VYY5_9MICO
MWISRIRVTGGFLKGLDVSLSDGLNVVIGPRGVGKTTLLELLRHALGVQHAEQRPGTQRQRQAFLDAVLGTGEVVLDIESSDGGARHLVVDAKGGGQRSDLSRTALVLGQNELEEIASDAASRLNLLDLRTGAVAELPVQSEIGTLTGDLYDVRVELEDRAEESKKRSRLIADRELLLSQETAILGGSTEQLSRQREVLRHAEERVIRTGQELERFEVSLSEIVDLLESNHRQTDRLAAMADRIESLPVDPATRGAFDRVLSSSRDVFDGLRVVHAGIDATQADVRESNIRAREAAAPIREELEEAEAGLGQITSQLRNVEAVLRALDENDREMHALNARYAALAERRRQQLDAVERAEETLYRTRAEVARSTTAQIANNVVIVVDHLADASGFRGFLQEALKGSGTRTALIDAVSDRVLPRQLLEMIESRDALSLSVVASITEERSQKLIDGLNEKETLESLARLRLSDRVDFRLRDGMVDKSVDRLSTGQKCAVTLPIILSERERTLILDQPEDHLDNAFLVTNIVTGLDARRLSGAQTIVATHNANIPVLGSADNVIVLESDGTVATVDVQGAFDSEDIVNQITRLMEGGRDAFARRSSFYAEHGGIDES